MKEELTRTELRRIAEEFKSERDAAKRETMRAFDERNILLNENKRLAEKNEKLESELRLADAIITREGNRNDALNACKDRCEKLDRALRDFIEDTCVRGGLIVAPSAGTVDRARDALGAPKEKTK